MSTRIEVPLPSLGDEDDTVTKATVSMWLAGEGQPLKAGDDLLEITTDKAAFVVPAPQDGTLVERRVAEGEAIVVGQVVGVLAV